MNTTTYGLDVAKRVVQLYWVDGETDEIVNRRFGRDDLIQYLSLRPPGRVALEACGSGHWWARKLKALGHEVVLLHAKFMRPFVQTNKTDAADARAIWTAVQQPGMRTVAAKAEDQQAMLSLHRIRSQLVKFRTMQVNQLRGLLYEFGASFRAGRVAGLAEIRARMAELEEALAGALICCLQDQLKRIDALQAEIDQLEQRIAAWQKQDAACSAISASAWHRQAHRDRTGGHDGRCRDIQVRTRVCCVPGIGTSPERNGRQGSLGLHIEARRSVPAHVADSRRAIGAVEHQGADAVADRDSGQTTCQRRGCGRSQQDGANGLGNPCTRSGLPVRPRERAAGVGRRSRM